MAAPEFVASQLDWAALQESNRELWLECARRAFEGLAAGPDNGRLPVEALIGALRGKLPAAEVDYAVEDALLEAGYAGGFVCFLGGGRGGGAPVPPPPLLPPSCCRAWWRPRAIARLVSMLSML